MRSCALTLTPLPALTGARYCAIEESCGAVLGLDNATALIFTTEDGVQNQMRIQDDGAFNYLISRPDADAPNGKDQILYRGHCVEG